MNFKNPEDLAWIVLLLPLAAAVIITLFTQRHGKFSAQLSIGAILGGFVISLSFLAYALVTGANVMDASSFNWLSIPAQRLNFDIGLHVD